MSSPFRLLLVLIILIFSGRDTQAQRVHFTDTGNTWTMLFFDISATVPMYTSYSNDWIIAGRNYHQLVTKCRWTFPDISLAVREDTTLGKIYFRFNSPTFWNASATDTLEHTLFDYGLKPGDTLKTAYSGFNFWYQVRSLDSVTLGTDYYRHWVMSRVLGDGVSSYEFIEGVGTNYSPVFSVCPYVSFQAQQLRCFTNRGLRPRCQPAIGLPFAGILPPSATDPFATAKFDNDTSCVFVYPRQAGVLGSSQGGSGLLPNPCSPSDLLMLPRELSKPTLHITDATGRVVLQKILEGQSRFPVGQYLDAPGVYHYILQDAATRQRYTGRFLFQ
jgi:hypothetical protein